MYFSCIKFLKEFHELDKIVKLNAYLPTTKVEQ